MRTITLVSLASAALMTIPVLFLLAYGFTEYLDAPLLLSRGFLGSVELTLASSAAAAAVIVLAFTPLSYYLSRGGNGVLEAFVDLPASIPHPIVGVALVFIDSPLTPLGRALQAIGVNFFDTFWGLLAALVVVSAPIYVKSLKSYFQALPRDYEEYARGLGASEMEALLSVVIPASKGGLVTASLIAISRAMSEFGSIAVVAYALAAGPFAGLSVASVKIYEYYEYYGSAAAISTSAVLILVGLALNAAVRLAERASSIGNR